MIKINSQIKYKNSIFVALHGSWNRTKKSGYKVVFVQLDDEGNYINQEDFITGWLQMKMLGEDLYLLSNEKWDYAVI